MDTYNKLRRATYYSDQKASRNYTIKFLEFASKRKDSFHMALANYYLGNSYVSESDFETGLSYYLKSANYFERKNDSARLSSVLNGIGAAYENSGNDTLSLNYFKKSQQISKSLGDLRRSAIALNNIGNIFKNRGDLISAKNYMELAVKDINTTKNLQYINPLSLNLANTYLDLKEFRKASDLYERVLKTIDSTSDAYSYGTALRGIGNTKLVEGNYEEAISKLRRARIKFDAAGFSHEAMELLPDLIQAFELNKNYKEGLELANYYQKLKDSVFNSEKDKNLSDALQKYETEKKDNQLRVLRLETEKKEQQRKLYLYLALLGLLTAILISILLFRNKKQNIILGKQKRLLETTIDEKNVLLKETHHRVKNSFQIVSSLLYLQSESMEDKEAKIAIKEAENRVRSMVLIHQKLYNKDELVGINTKDYFGDLVRDIFESHQFKTDPITYNINVEPMVLDIETITPLGLILNELIINTLKHAFDDVSSKSKIDIQFARKNKKLELKVLDNGKGFEGKIKNTSFGISLMNALSKKLKATLSYDSELNKGTEAKLIVEKFNLL